MRSRAGQAYPPAAFALPWLMYGLEGTAGRGGEETASCVLRGAMHGRAPGFAFRCLSLLLFRSQETLYKR